MTRTLRHFLVHSTLAIALLSLVACGGRNQVVVGGEGILIGEGPSLVGELEERSRDLMLDLASVLELNLDNPEQALARVRTVLTLNRETALSDLATLQDKVRDLDEGERQRYEAQFAALMGPANAELRRQQGAFGRRWPEASRELARILYDFGH